MTDDDFLRELVRERFGPPVPKAPRRDRASALAIAELLADLDSAEEDRRESA